VLSITNPVNTTSNSISTNFDMATMKSAALYTDEDNGNGIPIKIIVIATNTYGPSSASEANLDSAVYQSKPKPYAGTY